MIEKIKRFLYMTYIDLKWHPFNPWCVARMNLSYKHYIKSDLYKYRVEALGHEFAYSHYVELQEINMFVSLFTLRDKLKIIFTPFSCGDKHSIPPLSTLRWRYYNHDNTRRM